MMGGVPLLCPQPTLLPVSTGGIGCETRVSPSFARAVPTPRICLRRRRTPVGGVCPRGQCAWAPWHSDAVAIGHRLHSTPGALAPRAVGCGGRNTPIPHRHTPGREGGGGYSVRGENMNLEILARRNLRHFLKMSNRIMYDSQ